MSNKCFENPLLEGLHNRIVALSGFGLEKVWIIMEGEDQYHVANVLGYTNEQWGQLLKHSGLRNRAGALRYNTFATKLKCPIEQRNFQNILSSGLRNNIPWIRFESRIAVTATASSSGRSCRSGNSTPEEFALPLSPEAEKHLDD